MQRSKPGQIRGTTELRLNIWTPNKKKKFEDLIRHFGFHKKIKIFKIKVTKDSFHQVPQTMLSSVSKLSFGSPAEANMLVTSGLGDIMGRWKVSRTMCAQAVCTGRTISERKRNHEEGEPCKPPEICKPSHLKAGCLLSLQANYTNSQRSAAASLDTTHLKQEGGFRIFNCLIRNS